MKTFLKILFIALIFSCAFDALADGATDVMCNVIGGPMITVVVIGTSLLAIFGKMPWPALFSLGMFVAVFFGAPQVVNKITERKVCCLDKRQTLNNGKCVATPEYEYIGRDRCGPQRNWVRGCCSNGWVITSKGNCKKPGLDPSKYWK